jgi:hypothetical protein
MLKASESGVISRLEGQILTVVPQETNVASFLPELIIFSNPKILGGYIVDCASSRDI